MSPHAGTRAVLYIRVSTLKQADHGHSLEAQRAHLLAYAATHGLKVVEVVTDGGESAGTLNRPGLRRALELVESGDADVLVATKGDRITRNLRDLLNLAAELEAHGASIATADGRFDTTTPLGKAMTQMQGVFAELEREMASERTREGMAAARAKGIRLGRPPVGYRSEAGKLVPSDPERIALAERAATMNADGQSLRAIADTFNAEGIATGSGRPDARWHAPAVARLLKAAQVAA